MTVVAEQQKIQSSDERRLGDPAVEHMMSILDSTGDTRMMWDPDNEFETEQAKKQFDAFVKEKGYLAYSTDKNGNKATQMRKFDPKAARIILQANMAGG